MREIKFRVWDKESKYFCVNPEDYNMDYFMYMDGDLYWDGNPVEKDRYEIMQFTGLKDNNGKEIYEGDIIHCYMGKYCEVTNKIFFFEGSFCLYNLGIFSKENADNSEIIGNIYENPELIK